MDLRFSPSEQQFRADLRRWLDDVLPQLGPQPDPDDWPARRAYDTDWQRRLYEAGYAGINWPAEYGGRGATLTEQLIYLEETTRARAPYVGVNFVGLLHAGPTLMAEATPDQRAAHRRCRPATPTQKPTPEPAHQPVDPPVRPPGSPRR